MHSPSLSTSRVFSRRASGVVGRRSFLSALAAAGCGALLGRSTGWAAAAGAGIPALTAADLTVLQWVSSYARAVRLIGGCVSAKVRGVACGATEILAEIADLSSLQAALDAATASGITGIYADGNTLAFEYEGTQFTVRNLLPDAFAAALANLSARRKIRFAHEALVFDPTTGGVADPFHALTSDALLAVYPGAGLIHVFETLLDGLHEADRWELKQGAAFVHLKRRVLAANVARTTLAGQVTTALLQHLAPVADALPDTDIAALLRSRLIRQSLRICLGLSVDEIIARYEALRSGVGASASDAAAWLASVLAAQLQQGTADAWVSSADRFVQVLSRTALAEASQLAAAAGPGN